MGGPVGSRQAIDLLSQLPPGDTGQALKGHLQRVGNHRAETSQLLASG